MKHNKLRDQGPTAHKQWTQAASHRAGALNPPELGWQQCGSWWNMNKPEITGKSKLMPPTRHTQQSYFGVPPKQSESQGLGCKHFYLADGLRKQEWGQRENGTRMEEKPISEYITEVLLWAIGNHPHADRMPPTVDPLKDRRLSPPTLVHQLPALTGRELPTGMLMSPHFESVLHGHANLCERREDPKQNTGRQTSQPCVLCSTGWVSNCPRSCSDGTGLGHKSHMLYPSDFSPLNSFSWFYQARIFDLGIRDALAHTGHQL